MILLLGGTSDAAPIAMRLAEAGYRVLVSRATDVPLETPLHGNIESRCGPLDERGLAQLVDRHAVGAIVDATHPYAVAVHAAASRVALERGIPCLRFLRPAAIEAAAPGVELVADHAAAAAAAFRRGRPVLLTTGTRNLLPYVEQARRTGLRLIVRVLDHPHSLDACRRAGVRREEVIAGRGPFSVDDNRRHIRTFAAGVLVTKDGGMAGGTTEKLQAARAEGCDVIVIARPALGNQQGYTEIDSLLAALAHALTASA
jgi:precorrin-6A/cobalt-precorrin-6A reductase